MDENDVLGAEQGEATCNDEPRKPTLKESLLKRKARLELQLRDVNAALALVEVNPEHWNHVYKLLRLADHY